MSKLQSTPAANRTRHARSNLFAELLGHVPDEKDSKTHYPLEELIEFHQLKLAHKNITSVRI